MKAKKSLYDQLLQSSHEKNANEQVVKGLEKMSADQAAALADELVAASQEAKTVEEAAKESIPVSDAMANVKADAVEGATADISTAVAEQVAEQVKEEIVPAIIEEVKQEIKEDLVSSTETPAPTEATIPVEGAASVPVEGQEETKVAQLLGILKQAAAIEDQQNMLAYAVELEKQASEAELIVEDQIFKMAYDMAQEMGYSVLERAGITPSMYAGQFFNESISDKLASDAEAYGSENGISPYAVIDLMVSRSIE